MPIVYLKSTLPGGYSVVCKVCGGKEDWDIGEDEYTQNPHYWDNYTCSDCRKTKR